MDFKEVCVRVSLRVRARARSIYTWTRTGPSSTHLRLSWWTVRCHTRQKFLIVCRNVGISAMSAALCWSVWSHTHTEAFPQICEYHLVSVYFFPTFLIILFSLYFQSRKKAKKGDNLDDLKQELDIDYHKISLEQLFQRFSTNPDTVSMTAHQP